MRRAGSAAGSRVSARSIVATSRIRVVERNGEGGALPTVRIRAGRPGERRRGGLGGCLLRRGRR